MDRTHLAARRRQPWPCAIGLLLAVAAVVGTSAQASAAGLVGRWSMHETGGNVMIDEAGPSLEHGQIGPLVVLTSMDGYQFPGWRDNLTSTGTRLRGSVSASGGLVSVPDPNDVFDPSPGFAVSMDLKAHLTGQGQLPTKASNGAAPSYNIIQKGRSDSPGGFWKLEMAGSGQKIGRIRCVVADGQRSKVAVSAARVDDGDVHAVGCQLSGGRITAIVDGTPSSVSTSGLGSIHPGGQWGTSVWIGKKPGSTDPADAFAGWLENLTISIL